MRLKPFDEDDGYKVWLSGDELEMLIDEMGSSKRKPAKKRMAGELGGYCGLRRDEAAKTRPADVSGTGTKPMLRVWEDAAKLDKYRETPCPPDLARRIQAATTWGEVEPDDSVLDVTGRTINRWVKNAGERLYAKTGDEGWREVRSHDLRRTWGTRMLESGVLPVVVMWHGGWDDWETFRESYLGEFSPEALDRERGKVPWLNGGETLTESAVPQNNLVPIGSSHRGRS